MSSQASSSSLSPPKDLTHHVSRVSKNRNPSQIKRFYKYFTIPGIGNLAGGLPNSNYFPYDTLEAKAALPNRFKPTPNDPVKPPSVESLADTNPKPTHVVVPHDSHEPNVLRKIDLATALQYGQASGYPPLYTFIREFALTRLTPNIPYEGGAEVILTCGSTDGFAKSLEMLSNVWDASRDWIREREGIVCEEFAYMNAIQAARPRGLNIVPIKIDSEGMLAHGKGGLLDVMENWDKTKGRRPHLMYTVTMGQNPTSGLLSVKRRKEIYDVCQKFDIIIIEDDPYFYIQFPSAANALSMKYRGVPASDNHLKESQANYQTSTLGGKSSGSKFLDSLVPSYLSMDVDGRVVRLDTFSKTIAPGCRLGWLTAQPAFVERILRIAETSTQQPSGFVQSLVAELLIGPDQYDLIEKTKKSSSHDKTAVGWNMDGWVRWLEGLRGNYERRMQTMSQTLEEGKYFTTSKTHYADNATPGTTKDETFEVVSKTLMYDFDFPMAGMFLWLHLHLETHPLNNNSSTFSSTTFMPAQLASALWIFQTRKPYLILSAPGTMFAPTDSIRNEKGYQYLRLCFAAVSEEQVKICSENFVQSTRDFWDIEDPEMIRELLKELEEDAVDADEASMEDKVHERYFRVAAQSMAGGDAYTINPVLF